MELENKSPIRVCYIATGADLGGAPRSLLEMIEALLEIKAVEPYVILRSGGALESALDELGVPYEVFKFPSSVKSKKFPNRLKRMIERVYELRLAGKIKKGNFDIVHNNGILYGAGLRAAQRLGVRSICHVREFAQRDNGIEFLDEDRQRETMRKSDCVIFISEGVAKRFSTWTDDSKSIVLHDGFDVSLYYKWHKSLFSQPPYRLLLAGHIMPAKGQLEAVRATCELNRRGYDVRLTIIGHVKESDYYQDILRIVNDEGCGDIIEFREFANDLSGLRAESDISLMCSTANEGLGRVAVEGMLAGCLAVGSDKGGISEVIEDKVNGLLYDASDYLSLADCIEFAITNPEMVNSIAAYGQKNAREIFNSAVFGEHIAGIYNRVLSGERR